MSINICPTCNRLISLSSIPGGNPVARENPEIMAMYYAICEKCGYIHCESCVKENNGCCPNCGNEVTIQGPPEV